MKNSLVVVEKNVVEALESFSLDVVKSDKFKNAYSDLNYALEKLTELKKEVDSRVKEVMQDEYLATGTAKIENEDFSLTYIGGSVRESFDSKAFKEDHPKLYNQYVKQSATSASIRFTRKKK